MTFLQRSAEISKLLPSMCCSYLGNTVVAFLFLMPFGCLLYACFPEQPLLLLFPWMCREGKSRLRSGCAGLAFPRAVSRTARPRNRSPHHHSRRQAANKEAGCDQRRVVPRTGQLLRDRRQGRPPALPQLACCPAMQGGW